MTDLTSQKLMPSHGVINDFLPQDLHDTLLDWTIEQQPQFNPARIYYGEGGRQHGLDPKVRVGLKHFGLGPFERPIGERLLNRLPEIMAAAGYRGPEPRSIEFEITASGDGAHFAPHIDIPIGEGRRTVGREKDEDRMISSVYYYHREPKGFSGGALRLYRFGIDVSQAGDDDSIAFEPVQNSLVIFPSFAHHSVELVHCPSGKFADYRFGLNCFFCRRLTS
jgi:Rps23 Pro-64 3,4-dihydroxylase Tpa1-like proline 4-hydroxylase